MTQPLDHATLLEACAAGGASHLVLTTEMEPAAGPFASIAPARFATRSGGSTYAFEDRWIDGERMRCVLVDSKPSQLNRAEEAIVEAIKDGDETLSAMPRIEVTYAADDDAPDLVLSDLELPHRWNDAHIRAGTVEGKSVVTLPAYIAARNATPADVSALMELAPTGLFFGSWDSSRKSRQGRYPSVLTGEMVAVLADQSGGNSVAKHSGARIDPVAASAQLPGKVIKDLARGQQDEISPKLQQKVERLKDGDTASASMLGLGSVPPGVDDIAGVATRRIIRSHVLSFAGVRRLRFGGTPEANAAARALLVAVALRGLVSTYEDTYLRANCHLVESEEPRAELRLRFGETLPVSGFTVEAMDAVLAEALASARANGVHWDGQVLSVDGDPAVLSGAVETDDEA
ncbi:type I-U CRISPR-associated protein Cas7 [Enemella evansiae]|uniref:type I-G CRISPR-associated RAMP protein Csb1/Cas7g n=1 Tax=Enemella evansiae TaxID=2016499 RepID=UPI000B95FC06|nr:type I-U CRISPR-associated RAMP protein Csb1/Cas7u [Enemella evansiae]OYO00502.1 type I-U CRISPR-associated protein Cas7 [Enemella evansiae]